MTVLFTLFHNTLVELMHAALPAPRPSSQAYFAGLFAHAREETVRTYRRIVRRDLMARLLHPEVFAFYNDNAGRFIDRRTDAGVTFEFVQALRFGHAMVRPHYKVNDLLQRREELIDVLLTTSRGRPWRLPLDESWPVQWSKFFPVAESQPNLSKRIAPSLSADLISDLVFERIDDTGAVGIGYRDLVSGTAAPVWSIDPLVREIEAHAPALVRFSRLLADRGYRHAELRTWLGVGSAGTCLTEDDIAGLSRDPPLVLFVLFEAAHEMRGQCLGVLGSILIAEAIFKALRGGDPSREAPCGEAGTEWMRELAAASSMPGLVEFLHRRASIDETLVPFL